ncbi:MAG: winged helix-turn-helix domain-containing tetratricopeptide repeat protein [Bryobacteraceae bacterium]
MSSGPVRNQDTIRFGEDFEVDLRSYKLHRNGRVLKLERIPMEVLLFLLEQRGRIVTREQIIERIWGKDVFLDTDNSINGAIRKIRQVLKDDAEQPRFVQTITGKGYRFIAPVVEPVSEKPVAQEPVTDPPPQGLATVAPVAIPQALVADVRAAAEKPGTWRWALPVGIAVVLIAALGIYFQWFRSARPPSPSGRLMLAVLPFQNLTGDAGQDYISDGMTEEMIAQLGNLDPQHLGVIARTSVMHYKNSREQVEQIGRELGVDYVLEGSIRRDSQTMRITAQLIQVKDQTHLWARQYDRALSNLLALQGEIAQEIAGEIQLAFNSHKRIEATRQPSLSPTATAAYDLYLKGRYFWNKRTAQGLQQAIECFQQGIAKDPAYARAYAGLADSYAMISSYNQAPENEVMPKARAAALSALALDEKLAEAHTSLALITENDDWDWQAAEKEFQRGIQLDPNYATAHHWYAEYLAFQGRFDEALAESERARQLDPLSLIIAADKGAILFFSRQYDRAIQQLRTVLDMEPNFPRAGIVVFAYVQKGQTADALAEIKSWPRGDDAPWTWATEAYVYGRSGQLVQARRALEELEQAIARRHLDPVPLLILANAGLDKDATFGWVQKAYSEHSHLITTLKVDPIFDPLRTDPRFQKLLRGVGLAQ